MRSENLKVYVVWTPVLFSDNRQAAAAAMQLIPDERAVHFWDPDKSLGFEYAKVVALPHGWDVAWDIYMAYDPSSLWKDAPLKPADWMHNLCEDTKQLDGDKLRTSVQRLSEVPR